MTHTIKTAAILAAMAFPAHADDTVSWGGTNARLAPSDGPALATVTCTNRLTTGHDTMTQGTVSLGGFEVHIRVYHGAGDAPDRFIATPPDGYIAIPPQVDVPEGGQAVILIFAIDGAMS